MKSPCKGKCNWVNNQCTGCKRTIDEITNWHKMSVKEKQKVINRIEQLID